MPKIFEQVGIRKPKHSAFDLSHEKKMSMNMGKLVPCYLEEVLPGDSFKVSTEVMARMAPMIAPVQHRINLYVHYYFVPNRLVWDEWENFVTGGREGTSAPTLPKLQFGGTTGDAITPGSLMDYMGLPLVDANTTHPVIASELPFRAYAMIFNEYYRDQNLKAPIDITSKSEMTTLRDRAWEKDYFTSCLPWTQRGPEVSVPVSGTTSIEYRQPADFWQDLGPAATGGVTLTSPGLGLGANMEDSANNKLEIRNIDDINLTGVDVSINELRESSSLQRWLEKQARGGARYIETILSHFGVRSSDSRLQRPEYLGGGRQPMVISEVLNTTGTAEAPQGTMAGHGISVGTTNSFKQRFEEHGYVIGIMSVMPRTSYQQGIPRLFQRADKTDFYWPEFANLGEQSVENQELYFDPEGAVGWNNDTFGYQQRYAEYKYGISTVHGEYKDTLDIWHMGRIFETPPALNNTFIRSNPTDRIFAVEDVEQLYVQIYNSVKARRPMPFFSNPQLR